MTDYVSLGYKFRYSAIVDYFSSRQMAQDMILFVAIGK